MQYVRPAGSNPAFLLKAMNEASGELRHLFFGLRPRELLQYGTPPDEDWALMGIALHMAQVEQGISRQLQPMVRRREPEIPHVDFDDIPFRQDYVDADEEDLLEAFHYSRQRNAFLMWELDEHDWQRGGEHPYRGRLQILDIARDLYQHDLEHLWQARRMVEAMGHRL